MSEIKLFETKNTVQELISTEVLLERELQSLIEKNMETFFGVRFLKSEYAIANGRMDSIGLDENNCPVIFEYKRSINENVINQGLFYLDWLLDHKADFKLLVLDKLGKEAGNAIDWSVPCVICIANDFTKFDIHAVNQMQRNIKLVKYKKYNEDLILFEHLNAPNVKTINNDNSGMENNSSQKSHLEKLKTVPKKIKRLYDEICDYIESLGEDIVSNQLKLYIAYKKVQNIICIEIYNEKIVLFLKINPEKIDLEEGFTRDMRSVGHYGTGDLQVTIKDEEDFKKAKILIDRVYNEN